MSLDVSAIVPGFMQFEQRRANTFLTQPALRLANRPLTTSYVLCMQPVCEAGRFSVSDQVCGEIAPLMQHAQHVERLAVNTVEQQEGEMIQLPHA